MTDVLEDQLTLALELADLARSTLLSSYRPDFAYSTKDDGSPVTALDQEIERRLRCRITERFPEHGIFGEEYGQQDIGREYVWVLDPIDGTASFAAGLPDFGTLISLCRAGQPIIGIVDMPLQNQRCLGVLGRETTINGEVVHCRSSHALHQSVLISSGVDSFVGADALETFDVVRRRTAWNVYSGGCAAYLSLSRGTVDISLEGNFEPYDFCAVVPVIEGAGGCITDWQGMQLSLESGSQMVATGSAKLHDEVLAVLQGGGSQ
jgi:inositol-phosphate phosphatase/L-galactose 1-phosphate phosphatase/histidinol-phosphatase